MNNGTTRESLENGSPLPPHLVGWAMLSNNGTGQVFDRSSRSAHFAVSRTEDCTSPQAYYQPTSTARPRVGFLVTSSPRERIVSVGQSTTFISVWCCFGTSERITHGESAKTPSRPRLEWRTGCGPPTVGSRRARSQKLGFGWPLFSAHSIWPRKNLRSVTTGDDSLLYSPRVFKNCVSTGGRTFVVSLQ